MQTYSQKMQSVNSKASPGHLRKIDFSISQNEAMSYQKQIFIDVSAHKMYFEAKRALDRVGINSEDLIERPLDEFQYAARREKLPVTDDVI